MTRTTRNLPHNETDPTSSNEEPSEMDKTPRVVAQVRGLTKVLKSHSQHSPPRPLVDHIDFEVHEGECFGILGPNGAGKTTTMKMMYGSSEISSGEIFILGLNAKVSLREIKARIGIVPEEDGLDNDFTVRENLNLFASYHRLPALLAFQNINEVLKTFHLEDQSHQPISALSGGMRRRLAIARALISQPDLVIMDEPTTGLDPHARHWIWDFIKSMKSQKKTVILSTHYMQEAEHLCDRIAMMSAGKIFCMGKPKDLLLEHIGTEVVEFDVQSQDLNYYLKRLKENGYTYQVFSETVYVFLSPPSSSSSSPHHSPHHRSLDALSQLIDSSRIVYRKPSLDDIFLKMAQLDFRRNIYES